MTHNNVELCHLKDVKIGKSFLIPGRDSLLTVLRRDAATVAVPDLTKPRLLTEQFPNDTKVFAAKSSIIRYTTFSQIPQESFFAAHQKLFFRARDNWAILLDPFVGTPQQIKARLESLKEKYRNTEHIIGDFTAAELKTIPIFPNISNIYAPDATNLDRDKLYLFYPVFLFKETSLVCADWKERLRTSIPEIS